ncbi:MAG TPA: extracellular solute-binding protein, partial [Limnochordia bacterium]|nr:extracellular solute-binding protein [Limnochordia bacterium]
VHQGLLESLDAYLPTSNYVKNDDMLWPILDLYKVDGKLYALDKDFSADMTLYYNQQLFGNAGLADLSPTEPLTFDQLKALSYKLTKKDDAGKATQWGFGVVDFAAVSFQMMLRSAGAQFYANDGLSLDLEDNPTANDAANWWVDAARESEYAFGVPNDPWHAGKVGIFQAGYWFGPMAAITQQAQGSDIQSGNVAVKSTSIVGFAPAPIYGSKRVNTSLATGFAMLAASKHKDAAWKVLEYYMDGPPSITRTKAGWGLPSRKSFFQYHPQATAFDRLRYDVTVAEAAYVVPQYPNSYNETAVWDAWNQNFADAAAGKVSTKEFLHNVDHDTTVKLQAAAAK